MSTAAPTRGIRTNSTSMGSGHALRRPGKHGLGRGPFASALRVPAGRAVGRINGHISRGGDFEAQGIRVQIFSLPAGTFGWRGQQRACTCSGAATPGGIPTGVTYQRLQHPTAPGAVMTRLYSWDLYDGKIYAIAGYDNGDVRHFYDTAAVTEMGAGGTKPPGGGRW